MIRKNKRISDFRLIQHRFHEVIFEADTNGTQLALVY